MPDWVVPTQNSVSNGRNARFCPQQKPAKVPNSGIPSRKFAIWTKHHRRLSFERKNEVLRKYTAGATQPSPMIDCQFFLFSSWFVNQISRMVTWPGGNTVFDWVISYVDDSRFYRGHHGGREMVDFTIVGKGSFLLDVVCERGVGEFCVVPCCSMTDSTHSTHAPSICLTFSRSSLVSSPCRTGLIPIECWS